MEKASKPKRPIRQLILLSFLLVVFPVGSYLYLQSGYNYQLASWDEMDPIGDVSLLLDYPRPDSLIDIVYFHPSTTNDSVAIAIRNIYDAFADNPSIRFVALGASSLSPSPGVSQMIGAPFSEIDSKKFNQAALKFSQRCESVPYPARAYTVDVNGQVRRCYNLHSGKDVNRLVEQVALIMPRPEQQDVILERKTEL